MTVTGLLTGLLLSVAWLLLTIAGLLTVTGLLLSVARLLLTITGLLTVAGLLTVSALGRRRFFVLLLAR